jgi:hypothetical protein
MPVSSEFVILIHASLFQHGKDMVNYIQNELEALEREQKQIDKQAALLEKDLRRVMESGTDTSQEECLSVVFTYLYYLILNNIFITDLNIVILIQFASKKLIGDVFILTRLFSFCSG